MTNVYFVLVCYDGFFASVECLSCVAMNQLFILNCRIRLFGALILFMAHLYLILMIELLFGFLVIKRYLQKGFESLMKVRLLFDLNHNFFDVIRMVRLCSIQVIQYILSMLQYETICAAHYSLVLKLLVDTNVPNSRKTFSVHLSSLSFWLFRRERFYWMIKLTALSVRAIEIRIEVLTLLCTIIWRDVRLLEQLMAAVSEGALHAEFTLPI